METRFSKHELGDLTLSVTFSCTPRTSLLLSVGRQGGPLGALVHAVPRASSALVQGPQADSVHILAKRIATELDRPTTISSNVVLDPSLAREILEIVKAECEGQANGGVVD